MPGSPTFAASGAPPAPGVSTPYLLLAFVDTLADTLEIVGAVTVGAALLASAGVSVADSLLILLLTALILVLIAQVGASFFCATEHFRLALLGATVSLSLALSVGAILAFVQDWDGWRILAASAAPMILAAFVLLPVVAWQGESVLGPAHRRFLLVNLLGPTLAVVALASWQLLMRGAG